MITKDSALQQIIDFVSKNGRIPKRRDFTSSNGYCSYATICRLFGSWNNAIEASGFTPVNNCTILNKKWTKEIIVCYLTSFYSKYGRIPKQRELSSPSYNTIISIFGSFNSALEAAKLPLPSKGNTRWNKTSILTSITKYVDTFNRIPNTRDCNSFNLPSVTTVIRYFGSWNAAIETAGFTPNIQNGFGVDTYGLDGHLYRSRAEAYFVDTFLFNKYEYIIEPSYPTPYNKYYDWYIPSLDLYIELDGEIRPSVVIEKIAINQLLSRNCIFIKTSSMYKIPFVETLFKVNKSDSTESSKN